MHRIYLCASYARRNEMFDISMQLAELGFEVTSRWVGGSTVGVFAAAQGADSAPGTPEAFRAIQQARQAAWTDLQDVERADTLLVFGGQPSWAPFTGGRHVELGYALAMKKRVILVGPRENLFHWFELVEHFSDWDEALSHLRLEASGR